MVYFRLAYLFDSQLVNLFVDLSHWINIVNIVEYSFYQEDRAQRNQVIWLNSLSRASLRSADPSQKKEGGSPGTDRQKLSDLILWNLKPSHNSREWWLLQAMGWGDDGQEEKIAVMNGNLTQIFHTVHACMYTWHIMNMHTSIPYNITVMLYMITYEYNWDFSFKFLAWEFHSWVLYLHFHSLSFSSNSYVPIPNSLSNSWPPLFKFLLLHIIYYYMYYIFYMHYIYMYTDMCACAHVHVCNYWVSLMLLLCTYV